MGQTTVKLCKRGHPRTSDNLTKFSQCKACIKLASEEYIVAKREDCWLWAGPLANGYGRLYSGKHDSYPAHKVLYEEQNGPVPDGLELDHLCRVRVCINPEHLEAVTHAENLARRTNIIKEFCKRGHRFTPDSVRTQKDPVSGKIRRQCKICVNMRSYAPADSGKANVRRRLRYHVHAGHIIKPDICESCSRYLSVEAHHYDYERPYDVLWLCKGCHEKIHHALVGDLLNDWDEK